MSTDDLVVELFKRGQAIRDAWWSAYKANLERLSAELRANETFVGDYGHLVPNLPEPPPMPVGSDSYSSPAPGHSQVPPPLPDEWRDEQLRRWNEAVGRGGSGDV